MMEGKQRNNNSVIVNLASLVIVIAGLKLAAPVIVPLLFSVFVSIIAIFPLFWLYKKGINKYVAISVLIFAIIFTGLTFTFILGTSINKFVNTLPKYDALLKDDINKFVVFMADYGIDINKSTLIKYVNPSSAFKLIGNLLSQLGNLLTNLFLIAFISVFMLIEISSLPHKLNIILKESHISKKNMVQIAESIKNYLFIKTIVSLMTGVFVTVSLYLLKIDFAVLWGVIAFLLNYVPNIGSIIAAFPASLMALVQYGIGRLLIVIVIYLIVNIVVGNIIEPRYMGKELGLSALVVFLSLILWGWMFGIVGMFLSVPLTIIAKIILYESPDKKWIAILLSDKLEDG